MWTRSRPFFSHSAGAPQIERAMLSVVIGIAIVSLLVSLEALLNGTTAHEDRKCAGLRLRARATSAALGKSSTEASGASRPGRQAIAVGETGAFPFALLPHAGPDQGSAPRLALSRRSDQATAPPKRRDGDRGTGLDKTEGKSWATFTIIFVPYSAPAGALA